jgi:hypothetical protein
LTVKIIPPDDGKDALTVEAAMQQVLDAFSLLSAGETTVVWRLVSATTNSPFTIVAEADDTEAAVHQKDVFEQSLRELNSGNFPEAWKRPELQLAAASLLRRSSGEIASTEFTLGDMRPPLVISRDVAAPFADQPAAMLPIVAMPATSKRQVGSIDGILVGVTTYFGRPAIRVQERKTGREITCVILEALAASFSQEASMQDVWLHRRLNVRGVILYGVTGAILRVEASRVQPVGPVPKDLPPLHDPTFTGGLTAAEYLERFRAGELG